MSLGKKTLPSIGKNSYNEKVACLNEMVSCSRGEEW